MRSAEMRSAVGWQLVRGQPATAGVDCQQLPHGPHPPQYTREGAKRPRGKSWCVAVAHVRAVLKMVAAQVSESLMVECSAVHVQCPSPAILQHLCTTESDPDS